MIRSAVHGSSVVNTVDYVGHRGPSQLTANPGKADSAAQILAKLKARADSDAEPGTLQYEIVRYGDEFAVWEKYVSLLYHLFKDQRAHTCNFLRYADSAAVEA